LGAVEKKQILTLLGIEPQLPIEEIMLAEL
jgi:hypothetical protein